jgi:hypothetical protein
VVISTGCTRRVSCLPCFSFSRQDKVDLHDLPKMRAAAETPSKPTLSKTDRCRSQHQEASKQASKQKRSCSVLTLLWSLVSHTYTYLKPDIETFIPNMTTNENRLEIRRNWDLLMPCTLTFQFRFPASGCTSYLYLYLSP